MLNVYRFSLFECPFLTFLQKQIVLITKVFFFLILRISYVHYFNLVSNISLCNIFDLICIADDFDKAWKKLLKARYISDISSEESDIEKAKRRERAKKLPDANFTSSDGGNEIPLLSKWKTCTSCPKTNSVNTQLEEVRHANIGTIDGNICFT